MSLQPLFVSAHDFVPLSDRDVIEVNRDFFDGIKPEENDGRAINFQYILKTGIIPVASDIDGEELSKPDIFQEPSEDPGYTDMYINFSAKDEFIRALESIRKASILKIHNTPELKALLSKEHWDRDDRVTWERGGSEIITVQVDRVPGFGKYRTASSDEDVVRASFLNNLSSDIRDNTAKIEFDCEAMAIAEGIVLQQIENKELPETAHHGDEKVSSNYFYVIGRANTAPKDFDLGGHAFIISSATGNIIEATSDPNRDGSWVAYKENIDPDYKFEDFIRTGIAVDKTETIYAGLTTPLGEISTRRVEAG